MPAVTLPSARTTPFSFASASSVVARGCSSWLKMTGSPFLTGSVTGTISRSKTPSAIATAALFWLANANASWSARLMP
ncbi:hypothetical protein D3C72_2435530 [compost metagenome]